MFGLLFVLLLFIYALMSGVIVYHLHSYTINKLQAKQAIIVFLVVMAILVIIQVVLFLMLPPDIISGGMQVAPTNTDSTFY